MSREPGGIAAIDISISVNDVYLLGGMINLAAARLSNSRIDRCFEWRQANDRVKTNGFQVSRETDPKYARSKYQMRDVINDLS